MAANQQTEGATARALQPSAGSFEAVSHLQLASEPTRTIASDDIARADDVRAWRVGDAIGRYVVLRSLGRGGMGEVVAARDDDLGREVAIKLLRLDGSNVEERREARSRLAQEARVLARLSHPNIVAIYDVQDPGELAVVMELVAGTSLKEWMQTPRQWRQVVKLFVAAGRGLAAAHAAGIVHRDFKPANVLLDADEAPKVADFGIARANEAASATGSISPDAISAAHDGLTSGLTGTGTILGTPAYMAPEQHLGQVVDARADQFSFCVAFYQALFGQHPFRTEPGYQHLKAAVVQGRVIEPPLRQVPRRLWKALRRGLQADPKARYASMTELLAELEHLERTRGFGLTVASIPIASCGWALMSSDPSTPCTAGAELESAWRRQEAPRVQRAFAAAGEIGRDQWQHVSPILDRHVEAWRRTYEASCNRISDPRERDATLGCLNGMRHKLRAVQSVFASADSTTVLRAGEVVAGLAAPQACSDARSRADDADGGIDDAFIQRGAHLEALAEAGQYQQALAVAQELLAELPHAQLRRRAKTSYLLAGARAALGDWRAATREYEEAFALASAADDAALANAIAVALGSHHAAHRQDLVLAEQWARHAAAALERARGGPDDARLRARVLRLTGRIAQGKGQFERALAAFRKALELQPDGPSAAVAWQMVGDLLFRLERLAEAEAAFERSIVETAALQGAEHPDLGSAYNGLGVAQMMRGNLEAAEGSFKRALALWERHFGPEDSRLRFGLGNLGFVADARGQYQEALRFYERAVELRHPQADPNQLENVLVLGGLARAQRRLHQFEACIATGERGMATLQASGAETSMFALVLLPNLSLCKTALGAPEEALVTARTGVELASQVLAADSPDRAEIHQALGRALLALGAAEEAVQSFRLVVSVTGRENPSHVRAEVEFDLALALWEQRENRAEALQRAQRALKLYQAAGTHPRETGEVTAWLARRAAADRPVLP